MKNVPTEVNAGEKINISVNVTNTGKFDGDEVVQLYVTLPDSKLKKTIRALQGFKRISLKSGETKTVDFELNPSQFAARDEQNNAVVEAGKVQISIGGKQLDKEAIAVKKVVQAEVIVTGNRFVVSN